MTAPLITEPEMVPAILLDQVEEYWAALLAQSDLRQVHLIWKNRALQDEIEQLTADYCGTCGCRPCVNPSFCEACRRADQSRKRSRR